MSDDIECAACLETARRVERERKAITCPACGLETIWWPHAARTVPVPPPHRAVASPIEPFVIHPRREWRRDWNVDRDFELLARWLPTIEGRAAGIAPSTPSGAQETGRSDRVDGGHEDLAVAIAALERLGGIYVGHAYDAAVLVYAFLLTNTEDRRRGSFNEKIGTVFATTATRQAWLLNSAKSMGTSAARKRGSDLRDSATALFEHAKDLPPAPPDGWLALLRDEVTRLALVEADESKALRLTREQNRCAAAGGPARKERRKHLQRQPTTGAARIAATTATTATGAVDRGNDGTYPNE